MPKSLSSRLLFAFAFVIVLSLAISAAGTLLLLRDQQQEAAEERLGRLAEPITLGIALLEQSGSDPAAIQRAAVNYADSFKVHVLLVDRSGRVVFDSETQLRGETIDAFQRPNLPITTRGEVQFRKATYGSGDDKLLLFAPAEESLHVPSNPLLELQTLIYQSDLPPELIQDLIEGIQNDSDSPGTTLAPPTLRPLVAVSESEITSAWQDLIPQLAIAAGIALPLSAAVAVLISRSVSQRLARVTRAAQEMARGNYAQQLDPRGEDEIGRLASAFNVMARQVSRSHQTMRDLLANVSHELRTPLTSIQGFSQALEEGAMSSPEDYREAGRIINEETQRMRRLVDELIELSRLESGQIEMERAPVDLNDLVEECARRFERRLHETGASMQLELRELPQVQGDERRLEQVFSNLIENATRHTPAGGAITVRGATENGVVRVAVHNTGSYIPPEDLPRVFERFFQQDRNRARSAEGGAGLGLAIAEEVVQAHRGSIRASSDRDTGTEFEVTLPVGTPPISRHERPT